MNTAFCMNVLLQSAHVSIRCRKKVCSGICLRTTPKTFIMGRSEWVYVCFFFFFFVHISYTQVSKIHYYLIGLSNRCNIILYWLRAIVRIINQFGYAAFPHPCHHDSSSATPLILACGVSLDMDVLHRQK